jgi:GntR family transcriptional regulator
MFAYNMLYFLDRSSTQPFVAQVERQFADAIARGDLKDGERLPPARELAAALEINIHTVLGAYQRLQQSGLIDLGRGRGARVRSGHEARKQEALRDVRAALERARRLGITKSELAKEIGESQ